MRRERVVGWLAVAVGLVLAVAVQGRAPVGVPLYDGVVVAEPYRYLHPGDGQVGDPTSAETTKDVAGNISPVFAIATQEQPPQAQLVAQEDAFQLPAGTTQLQISIRAVDQEADATTGSIAGNVYRFAVVTQDGMPVTTKPCDACRTLVLRTPPDVTEGSVAQFVNGAWVPISTLHAGAVAMFQANPAALGDFAVISGAASAGRQEADIDPLLFGGIALALFFAAVAGLFWYRRRPPPVPAARLGPGRGRIASKRKGPPRPPSGRSGS